jgi:hypothetical protein
MKTKRNKFLPLILLLLVFLISIFYFVQSIGIFALPETYTKPVKNFNYLLFLVFIIISGVLFFLMRKSVNPIIEEQKSIPGDNTLDIIKNKADIEQKKIIEEKQKNEIITKNLLSELSSQKTVQSFCEKLLNNIAKEFEIVQGLVYVKDINEDIFRNRAHYAFHSEEDFREFNTGVGLTGQVAKNMEPLIISNIPKNYITVLSGLGKSDPKSLVIFPLIQNKSTVGVVEFASFRKVEPTYKSIFSEIMPVIGKDLAMLLYME